MDVYADGGQSLKAIAERLKAATDQLKQLAKKL